MAQRAPLVQAAGQPQQLQAADTIQSFTASTPARALNTTFAPSATKYTMCIYSIQLVQTAAQDGTCELRSDAASPPTTVRCSMRNVLTGTNRSVLVYIVPPGQNVRLVTSGTGTFTIANQTEITFNN
jgi:hypothetical protein